jgi:hypothetical protein
MHGHKNVKQIMGLQLAARQDVLNVAHVHFRKLCVCVCVCVCVCIHILKYYNNLGS